MTKLEIVLLFLVIFLFLVYLVSVFRNRLIKKVLKKDFYDNTSLIERYLPCQKEVCVLQIIKNLIIIEEEKNRHSFEKISGKEKQDNVIKNLNNNIDLFSDSKKMRDFLSNSEALFRRIIDDYVEFANKMNKKS